MTKTNNTLLWILGFTVVGILIAYWFVNDVGPLESGGILGDAAQGVSDIVGAISRGPKVTHAPYDKTTGVVPGSPDSLAAQAGVDSETYSLARAVSSEEGNSSNAIKLAVAWAINNYATNGGKTIESLVTHAKLPTHSGHYGTQRNIEVGTVGYNGSDRYCSTANDPYAGDIEIASNVLTGNVSDPTNGATQFDRPSGETNPDQIAANRAASGMVQVAVDGVSDSDIRFWAVG